MAVFYSFHYGQDAWRVQQILQMGALDGQTILNSQDWEEVKRKGAAAIESWIDNQMKYKSAVVVLIGSQTASRPWVKYEIGKAWNDKRSMLGIQIHGLADANGYTDSVGTSPFAEVQLSDGGTVADHIPVFTPMGATSQQRYANIRDNLTTWAANGYKPS